MINRTDAKEGWKQALNYLLRYERRGGYREQRVKRARDLIRELLQKGSIGQLTTSRFEEIRDALDMNEHRIARDAFFTNVHSTVCTTDWMDAFAQAIRGKTVLEIGAGRGSMMMPMNTRGVKWIGVQTNPDPDCMFRPIPVIDYLDALKAYRKKIDFIYLSWPSLNLGRTSEVRLAEFAKAYDIPLILVCERRMATSSTNELWDEQWRRGYRLVQVGDHNPPRWRGLQDAMWVSVDEKHLQGNGESNTFSF